MEVIRMILMGDYLIIETNVINFVLNSFKKVELKKEDNGKPIILVESNQQ